MISFDIALQQVLENISPLPPIRLPLDEATGLVLAAPAIARWDMPRNDNSAMDGFAIAGNEEPADNGFNILGSSYAGHPYPGDVRRGQAVRITTGAALPRGTDTVVPLEECEEGDGQIRLTTVPKPGQHVRYQGEEYRCDELLIGPGTRLHAGEIALLASAGVETVKVFPRPRVALISTGDELVELGQVPGPGQIINSNLHFLKTRLQEYGCVPIGVGIGADDPARLQQVIDQALAADVIISTGGVSVGEKDYVQNVLDQRGFRKIFWKVAIKPGKPVLFGLLDGKPYFGLPGNPAATAATFELFAGPALKKLAGRTDVLPETRRATLTDEVVGGGKRQAFLWCRLEWCDSGYRVSVAQRQGSGQIRSLLASNALLSLPIGTRQLEAGEEVEVLVLSALAE